MISPDPQPVFQLPEAWALYAPGDVLPNGCIVVDLTDHKGMMGVGEIYTSIDQAFKAMSFGWRIHNWPDGAKRTVSVTRTAVQAINHISERARRHK
jgi:hypothetical protein